VRRLLNRLSRPVALLVIAAQLLLGWPGMASAQTSTPAGSHAHCNEMFAVHHEKGCPCCPDDSGSMKDCLVMCSLAAAVAPSVIEVVVTPSRVAAFVEFPDYQTTLADPPLKPPPIA
jgi:hypothetical protein